MPSIENSVVLIDLYSTDPEILCNNGNWCTIKLKNMVISHHAAFHVTTLQKTIAYACKLLDKTMPSIENSVALIDLLVP